MKTNTYKLFISIFAICVLQGILTEEAMKCRSYCFEGCSKGVCRDTLDCLGCSRKYYEDKLKAKEKIRLMRKRDDEKIEKIKIRNEKEMEELLEKHEAEMNELTDSQKEAYESLVNTLDEELKSLMAEHKEKLLNMRTTHAKEIKELKLKHISEIQELKEKHKQIISRTKIVLKSGRNKKAKELETICRGHDCPCCSLVSLKVNCNQTC